jgi:predicted Zn-dependent protease
MVARNSVLTFCGLVVSAGITGCAGMDALSKDPWLEPEVSDVRPLRKERTDATVAELDRKRNETQYLAAQSSWRQGDYPRCRESLEKVLARDPNHRASLLLLADVALETDNAEEAVETLRRATALDPQDAEAAYRLGIALEASDKVAEAVPYLRRATASQPQSAKYADALCQAEQLLAASSSELKIAVAKVADENEFPAALADWQAGREAEAAQKVVRVLRANPNHIDANILQAEIDLAAGRGATSIERMEKLSAAYPHDPQVRRACGLILQAGGDLIAANRCFAQAEQLAAAQADRSRTMVDEGVVQASYVAPLDDGKTPTAPAVAEPAAPEPPVLKESHNDAGELLGRGEAALENKQLDEARRLMKAAIDASGDDPQPALTASIAALKLEQSALSYELASHAVRRFPTSAALHRVRGLAAYRMRRYSDAEAALRQSLSLDNSQALSYFLLGSALEHLGKTEEGARYRSEAARLDSRYALRK